METIKAKEGMWLTQAAETETGARVYSKELWLAVNDSAENWRDATDEEYQAWKAEMDALMEAETEGTSVQSDTETYEALVVEKIRLRYSVDDELALERQRETKPDEWEEYYAYCEQCKAEAKAELGHAADGVA